MKEIVCNLSMFSYSHPIYIADDTGTIMIGRSDEDGIVNDLFKYAAANEIFNIHLFGVQDFIQPFADDLAEKFITAYGEKNYNIIIN